MATMNTYFLSSYTNDTFTDIAQPGSGEVLIVRNIIIHNTTASTIEVSVRVTDSGGSALAVIHTDYELTGGETLYIGPGDLFLVFDTQQKLQVDASAAGVNFIVCGGIE
jgi:hypothetical protein